MLKSSYINVKVIGSGKYGRVFQGYDAVKQRTMVIKNNTIVDHMDGCFVREADILTKIRKNRHPFLITVTDITTVRPFAGVATPPGPGEREDTLWFTFPEAYSDLSKVIPSNYSWDYVKLFIKQLTVGLQYLHSQGIHHGDIKPSNILYCQTGKYRSVKYADFGLSKHISQNESPALIMSGWYRAPEIIAGQPFNLKADVWSLGMTILEFFIKRPVLSGVPDEPLALIQNIVNIFPQMIESDWFDPAWMPRPPRRLIDSIHILIGFDRVKMEEFDRHGHGTYIQLLDMLSMMLVFDSENRASMTELLTHPFVATEYVARVVNDFPPIEPEKPVPIIHQSAQRALMRSIFIDQWMSFYGDPGTDQSFYTFPMSPASWYHPRTLVLAIDLMYRYHEYLAQRSQLVRLGEALTPDQQDAVEMSCIACLYMAIKYMMLNSILGPVTHFLTEGLANKPGIADQLIQFELVLLTEVFNFEIYRSNIYDEIEKLGHTLDFDTGEKVAVLYLDHAENSSLNVQELAARVLGVELPKVEPRVERKTMGPLSMPLIGRLTVREGSNPISDIYTTRVRGEVSQDEHITTTGLPDWDRREWNEA